MTVIKLPARIQKYFMLSALLWVSCALSAPKLIIPKVPREKSICFALYTLHDHVLKLTAQLYPLGENEPKGVALQIKKAGQWKTVAETVIVNPGWTAPFRVPGWDMSRSWPYRVVACGGVATYTGIIRKNPVDKEEIVVAGFTGNSNQNREARPDIIKNIKVQDPDLLFFSGDQSYDHRRHLAAWLLFGRQFGEIIKDRPTVCIPDDHDVGQANLWGEGGIKTESCNGDDGGYCMPVEYVNEVQRAQTSHLPDPYDPTPIKRGITVYYTRLNVGGVDFAIIEDRKFKSGPDGKIPNMGPRPDHISKPDYDPKDVDVPGLKLLGDRQLAFLNAWSADWQDTCMKVVLSQTVFANAAHLHGGKKNRLLADMDSNGWPQTGRNKALRAIRKCFGFMLCGDQHLAMVLRHGVDDWNDSGYSFCVPSIINFYNRWWLPLKKPFQPVDGPLEHLGWYLDGFHNKLTVHAYANPDPREKMYPKYDKRAAGYGLVRFNKKKRTITMECWPRGFDAAAPDQFQFPGWPITISQKDNYARKPAAYLPRIKVTNAVDPVVQVIHEASGEIIYTLRIQGDAYRPKVFQAGIYTVVIQQGKKTRKLTGIKSLGADARETLTVSL